MILILCIILCALTYNARAHECACATTNVNVRTGSSTRYHILKTLKTGNCLPYKGDNSNGWVHVDYNGSDGYISGRYVTIQTCAGAARAQGCACATTNVNVRTGSSTRYHILKTLKTGNCLPYKGDNSNGWVHVNYHGSDGYISGRYITLGSCGGGNGGNGGAVCPTIVSRAEWGARQPKNHTPLSGATKYVFVHHSTGEGCTTRADCSRKVRSFQNYHMNSRGWSDIGYSFLVGEDGNAYEGRGWNTQGAHTKGYNSVALGICMIGNFQNRLPNQAALDTLHKLIECGKANGKIKSDYILKGHRDIGATACPGQKLYDLIKTWPHYR
ncbi:peptidoglycan recognition protein 1-like [Gigantopelta aegis]|uniref:peptidoglycan recognition protein 1-like n=1 Tax=Gigantopelta aegis TaxID=1735272 RepID=UPI001B88D3B5|nr:peptidoglycan recognition protein 1-like [Gigantopelta aegis]